MKHRRGWRIVVSYSYPYPILLRRCYLIDSFVKVWQITEIRKNSVGPLFFAEPRKLQPKRVAKNRGGRRGVLFYSRRIHPSRFVQFSQRRRSFAADRDATEEYDRNSRKEKRESSRMERNNGTRVFTSHRKFRRSLCSPVVRSNSRHNNTWTLTINLLAWIARAG